MQEKSFECALIKRQELGSRYCLTDCEGWSIMGDIDFRRKEKPKIGGNAMKKGLFVVLVLVLIVAFAASAIYLAAYFTDSAKSQMEAALASGFSVFSAWYSSRDLLWKVLTIVVTHFCTTLMYQVTNFIDIIQM